MEESEVKAAAPEMLRLAQELVPLLLQGDDPRLKTLRCQWEAATIRISNSSSWGFYADISLPPELPRILAPDQGGGNAVIPVLGADQPSGCILYVVDGRLHFLEVYNVVAHWTGAPTFGRPDCIEPLILKPPIAGARHGTSGGI